MGRFGQGRVVVQNNGHSGWNQPQYRQVSRPVSHPSRADQSTQVSDELARQRIGEFSSFDPEELGVEYPSDPNGSIRLHFQSSNPNLGLRYATRDGAWSVGTHEINAHNLISATCEGRYRIDVKHGADGKYEYLITLNPVLAATKIEINGKGYYIPPRQPGVRSRVIKPGEPAKDTTAHTPPPVPEVITPPIPERPAVTPVVYQPAPAPVPPEKQLQELVDHIAPEVKSWGEKLSDLNPWKTFGSDLTDPSLNYANVIARTILPLHHVVGDYHVPPPAEREKQLVTSVTEAADGVLPLETRKKIREMFSEQNLREGSREVRQFFNRTLAAMNDYAATHSSLSYASDELRQQLGLPEGTKVMLALTGAATFGWDENEVARPLELAFGDTIRVRAKVAEDLGTVKPVARPGDVVVLQAFEARAGDPLFMSMSVLSGEGVKRGDWTATTFDATYRGQPHYYVRDAIDRPGKERVETFDAWSKTHENWLAAGGPLLDSLAAKEAFQVEQRKQKDAEAKRIAERNAELARQSAQLSSTAGGDWKMGYEGYEITERRASQKSFRAVNDQTGTFTVEPDAGIQLDLKDAQGKRREFTINSWQQLERLSEQERKILEYVVTTPYENDAERSVGRIVSMFPSQTYRPGSVAGLFYSPRYYGREVVNDVLPEYQRLTTPEQQRKFLGGLLEALKGAGTIGEGTVAALPAEISGSK